MQNMSGGKTALGLDANVGALLCYVANLVCYLGLIYSIIVVVTDKTNRLARFHAFQSIFLTVLGLVLGIGYGFLSAVLGLVLGDMALLILPLLFLVSIIIGIVIFVFMIIAAIKAYGGEMYKIPIVGNFAESYSA